MKIPFILLHPIKTNKIDKKLAASKFIEMIETDKQGDIFTITIGSNEAEFSKQLVESLLQELERYQIEKYTHCR